MRDIKYKKLPELIPEELIQRAKKLSPAQICDGMKGMGIVRDGCMDADMMPVDESKIMIGTAYTVDTKEGDNFPIHVALYQGEPGYVMVISGKGYKEKSYLGDLIGSAAEAIGLNGIVVDGLVRDKLGLKALKVPIYSKGYMQRGPGKEDAGEINTVVTCAGIKVEPGDLVIGDYDGVTVIPRAQIEEVLEKAEKKDEYEAERRRIIDDYATSAAKGNKLPELAPPWVIEMKEKMGF